MKTNEKRTVETSPPNATIFTVQQLATGTEYSFRIMAVNVLGESNYTTEIVRGSTLSKFPGLVDLNFNCFCVAFTLSVGDSLALP